MVEWVDAVIQGLMLGGLYTLLAIGLSLAYGVMRLVNIAHGDFIVLAAYLALLVVTWLGIHPFAAIPAVVVLMFAIGYLLQRGLLNRTLGPDILPPLLVTFGLSIVIRNLLRELFSADTRALKIGDLEMASLHLGDKIAVGWLPLIIFCTAIVLTLGLELLFSRTDLGMAFRATSDDQPTARLMGINDRHVYALALAVSFGVVAIGGVFMGIGTGFSPDYGPAFLLYAFEAVVIGGLGSFWGTLAGGAILGVAQGIGSRIDPGWGILLGHLVFLTALLVRPTGLFPRTA
jgi:branched-chain amino acid transport system permease protein